MNPPLRMSIICKIILSGFGFAVICLINKPMSFLLVNAFVANFPTSRDRKSKEKSLFYTSLFSSYTIHWFRLLNDFFHLRFLHIYICICISSYVHITMSSLKTSQLPNSSISTSSSSNSCVTASRKHSTNSTPPSSVGSSSSTGLYNKGSSSTRLQQSNQQRIVHENTLSSTSPHSNRVNSTSNNASDRKLRTKSTNNQFISTTLSNEVPSNLILYSSTPSKNIDTKVQMQIITTTIVYLIMHCLWQNPTLNNINPNNKTSLPMLIDCPIHQ